MTLDEAQAQAAWMAYVAARFPQHEHAAAIAWWNAYAIKWGTWDRCRDEGHEFWCRFGEGSCARRGPLTCNETDEEREALDRAMDERRARA